MLAQRPSTPPEPDPRPRGTQSREASNSKAEEPGKTKSRSPGAVAQAAGVPIQSCNAQDPAAWRVPAGARRSYAQLAFRWHIGSVETIVHQSLHHVLENGVRTPDHWAAGVQAASLMRRPAEAVTWRGRNRPEWMRRPAAARLRDQEDQDLTAPSGGSLERQTFWRRWVEAADRRARGEDVPMPRIPRTEDDPPARRRRRRRF